MKKGQMGALKLLLEYNKEDVLNLITLEEIFSGQLKEMQLWSSGLKYGRAGYRIQGTSHAAGQRRRRHPCVILSHGLISSKESPSMWPSPRPSQAAGSRAAGSITRAAGRARGGSRRRPYREGSRTWRPSSTGSWVTRPSIAGRIGLLGSSFGGCTSLVKAARDDAHHGAYPSGPHPTCSKKRKALRRRIASSDSLYEDFASYDLLPRRKGISRLRHPWGNGRGRSRPRGQGHLPESQKAEKVGADRGGRPHLLRSRPQGTGDQPRLTPLDVVQALPPSFRPGRFSLFLFLLPLPSP